MIINMIIAFRPGLCALTSNIDDLLAETTPEVGFASPTHATFVKLPVNGWCVKLMTIDEMLSECLSAMTDLAALLWNALRRLEITFPNFQ